MATNNFLTFAGKRLSEFGVGISGSGSFAAAERDVEMISVPGRSGDLTIDNGRFRNITVSYPAHIVRNIGQRTEELRNFLLSQRGYKELRDTYHPGEFRMGRYIGGFNPDVRVANRVAEFVLQFDCKPQRWLDEGMQPIADITGASSIMNKYQQTAKPLIRAYGTGTFSIGGVAVQITAADVYTDIDCDLMEAYKGSTNKNAYIVLTNAKFPELAPGANAVTLSGITKLQITPRWWIL